MSEYDLKKFKPVNTKIVLHITPKGGRVSNECKKFIHSECFAENADWLVSEEDDALCVRGRDFFEKEEDKPYPMFRFTGNMPKEIRAFVAKYGYKDNHSIIGIADKEQKAIFFQLG